MARGLLNDENAMYIRFVTLASVAALALSTVACGGYRVVSRSPEGGTVALEGAQDTAREKAEEYMGTQCPFGYQVLPNDWAPSADRELRITYRCKTPGDHADQRQAIARQVVVRF